MRPLPGTEVVLCDFIVGLMADFYRRTSRTSCGTSLPLPGYPACIRRRKTSKCCDGWPRRRFPMMSIWHGCWLMPACVVAAYEILSHLHSCALSGAKRTRVADFVTLVLISYFHGAYASRSVVRLAAMSSDRMRMWQVSCSTRSRSSSVWTRIIRWVLQSSAIPVPFMAYAGGAISIG